MMALSHTYLVPVACVCSLYIGSCSNGDRRAETPDRTPTVGGPVSLVDAVGRPINLQRPADRLVSLAPNLTEVLAAIGADDLLVGRTSYCDFPRRVKAVRVVGDLQTINYEAIVSLHPDVVLMSFAGNSEASYLKLRELGLRPFAFRASTFHQLFDALETIGVITGRVATARHVADSLRHRVQAIHSKASRLPRTSVFLVVNRSPLMTVASGYLAEAIEFAGGENIASGTAVTYPAYSRESLIRRDPDVIIVPSNDERGIDDLLSTYPEWRSLRAVRTGRIHIVSPDPFMRPGPRLVSALETMFKLFHPADSIDGEGNQPK